MINELMIQGNNCSSFWDQTKPTN